MKKLTLAIIFSIIFPSAKNTFATNNESEFEPTSVISSNSQNGCSFMYSPINFCDETHKIEVKNAISNLPKNFNKEYILLTIDEWPEYNQKSIVVINPDTRIYYPLPIDAYSGTPTKEDSDGKNGKLEYSFATNKICITGDILVYRSISSGEFCFYFDNGKFNGHQTAYMQ